MRILIIISLVILAQSVHGQDSTQVEKQFVFDRAELLTQNQKDSLTNKLISLKDSVGSQLVVLIITSLNGESIEDLSLRTMNVWGIGRKDYDDGILITVALADRKMRIGVGDGLAKIISDDIAMKIVQEEMAPNFRANNFYKGLDLATDKIIGLIMDNINLVGH